MNTVNINIKKIPLYSFDQVMGTFYNDFPNFKYIEGNDELKEVKYYRTRSDLCKDDLEKALLVSNTEELIQFLSKYIVPNIDILPDITKETYVYFYVMCYYNLYYDYYDKVMITDDNFDDKTFEEIKNMMNKILNDKNIKNHIVYLSSDNIFLTPCLED